MRYATITAEGVTEIREDTSEKLPDGAIILTDDEFKMLAAGLAKIMDGAIVDTPYQPEQRIVQVPQLSVDGLASILVAKGILSDKEVQDAKQ